MKTKTPSAILRCVCLLLVQAQVRAYEDSDFESRVLNGDLARPEDFKFLVHLNYPKGRTDWICSGAVISRHFILTAAHCMYERPCSKIQIFPSTWKPRDRPKYYASKCHLHYGYETNRFDNDIGLMETKEDLLADGAMLRIPLPEPDTYFPLGVPALIVGWGKTEAKKFPGRLMRATVHVSDWDKCNGEFQDVEQCGDAMKCPVPEIPRTSFCTEGSPPRVAGSCVGDSGGPVLINGVMAGVHSGVILEQNECKIGTPSLHTSVSEFVPWIMTIADL